MGSFPGGLETLSHTGQTNPCPQAKPRSQMTLGCESVLGHRKMSQPSYLCSLHSAGLIGPVTVDKIPLSRFTIYSLEMKMTFFKKYVPSNPNPNPNPDIDPKPDSDSDSNPDSKPNPDPDPGPDSNPNPNSNPKPDPGLALALALTLP